ncbi:MAG: oligosaccharide flippase family protein [Chloroflexota bacterium]
MTSRLAAISTLLRSRAATDLAVTLGGRSVQIVAGLLGNVLSARTLGPSDFGRFGLVMGAVTIAGTVADAGLTFAAIRFIARHVEEETTRARATARTYFALRLLSGLIVTGAGVCLALPLSMFVIGSADLTPYLQVGFIILLGLSISSYPGTVLTGLARFDLIGLAGLLNALITVGGIVLLFISGNLNLGSLVLWNVALPVASTIPAWLFLPREWLPWRIVVGESRSLARDLWRFGRWAGISTIGAVMAGQIDLILLGRIVGPGAVGTYSVAVTLAARLDILNQSLYTIMMPRASRLRTPDAIRGYMRRIFRGSGLLALGLLLVAVVSQPIITLLYGAGYSEAAPLFLVLLLVVASDLITTSLSLVTFSLNKPSILAVIEWLRVLLLAVVGVPLISAYGALGAALSRVTSRIGSGLFMLRTFKRIHESTDEL